MNYEIYGGDKKSEYYRFWLETILRAIIPLEPFEIFDMVSTTHVVDENLV